MIDLFIVPSVFTFVGFSSDSSIAVQRATLTNFLEDEKSELQLQSAPSLSRPTVSRAEDTILNVNFRGFQVHTVKLTVAAHQDV